MPAVQTPPANLGQRAVPRSVWLGGLAFAVSLAGTLLLADAGTRAWGEILLAVAVVCALVGHAGQRWTAPFAPRIAGGPRRWGRRHSVSAVGVAFAILLLPAADAVYLAQSEQKFGLAGWLWLAGIALLVCALFLWPQGEQVEPSVRVAGAPLALHYAVPTSLPVRSAGGSAVPRSWQPAWTLWEVGLLAAIFALGLSLRVWDLSHFPYAIHPDEVITGRVARAAYVGGSNPSIFSTLWLDIDLPALWFVLVSWSLKVGDFTLASLRLPAALFGAFTIVPLYGLVRGVWGRSTAFTGALIFAFSASQLQYSRVTVNNIVTPFFWSVCFFFILRGLRSRRPIDWGMAGLSAGLSEHFYYGTHLLPILMIAFVVYLVVVHWREGWRYVGNFGVMALGYMAGFGPLLAYYTRHPDLYFGRGSASGVLMWSHIPASWDDLVSMYNTLWPLFSENLLGISTHPGQDTFYWGTFLLPAEGALLILGVGLLIWKWRHPASFLMLLSGFGVLFVGGTLVHGVPFYVHWSPAFFIFYVALAVPVGGWLRKAWQMPGSLRWIGPSVVGIGLAALLFMNLDFYFRHYDAPPEAEARTAESREQTALGPNYYILNVGATREGYDPETNGYLLKGQQGAQMFNPGAEAPPAVSGKGLAFFFRDNDQYRPQIEAFLPGGTERLIKTQGGLPLFNMYTVSPQQVADAYGVYLEIFSPGAREPGWRGAMPYLGVMPTNIGYPLTARWSGSVYVSTPEPYRLYLDNADSPVLLTGQDANGVVQLGWHRFNTEVNLLAPEDLKLMSSTGGAPGTEVPATELWPDRYGQGLLGAAAGASGRPMLRVDRFIGFTAPTVPQFVGPAQGAAQPLRIAWTGEVYAPQSGLYTLEVDTGTQVRLLVDGKKALCIPAVAGTSGQAQLTLATGWHPVRLDYIAQPDRPGLDLYWTPPSGQRFLIPAEALRYSDGSLGSQLAQGTTPPTPPESINCSAP